MAKLAPIELEDGTVIYMEATDEVIPSTSSASEGTTRTSKGNSEAALQQFQNLQTTIRIYTAYTLDAFRKVAIANVDKVTLEFGVKVAGEAGVPYITKATGECNIKITVECSFPE